MHNESLGNIPSTLVMVFHIPKTFEDTRFTTDIHTLAEWLKEDRNLDLISLMDRYRVEKIDPLLDEPENMVFEYTIARTFDLNLKSDQRRFRYNVGAKVSHKVLDTLGLYMYLTSVFPLK